MVAADLAYAGLKPWILFGMANRGGGPIYTTGSTAFRGDGLTHRSNIQGAAGRSPSWYVAQASSL